MPLDNFDETRPADNEPIKEGAEWIRDTRSGVKALDDDVKALDDDVKALDKDVNVWTSVSSDYTASEGENLLVDTSGGAVTVTLPSSPAGKGEVRFADAEGSWGTNNLTVDGNGNDVLGDTTFTADVDDWPFSLVYNGTQWVFGNRV